MNTSQPAGGDRAVHVPGVFNVRDFGSLPISGGAAVRRGLLFRSAQLSDIEPAGTAILAELGLRTVVDLRTRTERDYRPDQLAGTGAVLRAIPLLDMPFSEIPDSQADLYAYMTDSCTRETAAVVTALAAPGALPGLIHCAVGKDRTGFLTGVILSLLGVPVEEIVEDFLLSNAALGLAPELEDQPRQAAGTVVGAGLLVDALDRIRKQHGSIEEYLRAGGVTDLDIESLRAALIERV